MAQACRHNESRHNEKRAPVIRGPFIAFAKQSLLLERAVDRSEFGVQRGAETVDGGNDRERNASSNQAVFDGGGTGLVLHETSDQVLHRLTPCTRGCRTRVGLVWPAFSAP